METTWDDALAALAGALTRCRPEEIGILASPQMANEDLFLLTRLADHLGVRGVDYRVPPKTAGDEDNFLIRADKNTEFKFIQKVMEVCGKKGIQIWKLQLAASEDPAKVAAREAAEE